MYELFIKKASMIPVWQEKADAASDWKEYTAPDGRKYYYNKITKESKWTIPDEMKRARELGTPTKASPGPQSGAVQVSCHCHGLTDTSASVKSSWIHPRRTVQHENKGCPCCVLGGEAGGSSDEQPCSGSEWGINLLSFRQLICSGRQG
jgi:hypothetical protein